MGLSAIHSTQVVSRRFRRLKDMPITIDEQTYYRTSEACQVAGISRATLFRWLKAGIIEDVAHKDRRGWRLFTENDISRIKNQIRSYTELLTTVGAGRTSRWWYRNEGKRGDDHPPYPTVTRRAGQ